MTGANLVAVIDFEDLNFLGCSATGLGSADLICFKTKFIVDETQKV